MTTTIDVCPACSSEPGYQGRYCAPLRCYCGHDVCPSYAKGWKSAQDAQDASERARMSPRVPASADELERAQRLVQRALGNAAAAPASQPDADRRRLRNRKQAEAVMPKQGTIMHDVLAALADAYVRGHKGATHGELARHLQLQRQTERSTIVRLCGSGLVFDSGIKRSTDGSDQVVWQPSGWALRLLGHDVSDE